MVDIFTRDTQKGLCGNPPDLGRGEAYLFHALPSTLRLQVLRLGNRLFCSGLQGCDYFLPSPEPELNLTGSNKQ
jgi:hypothetical protein